MKHSRFQLQSARKDVHTDSVLLFVREMLRISLVQARTSSREATLRRQLRKAGAHDARSEARTAWAPRWSCQRRRSRRLEGVGKLLTGSALAPDMTQAPGPVVRQDLPRLASITTAMARRSPRARQESLSRSNPWAPAALCTTLRVRPRGRSRRVRTIHAGILSEHC